MDQTFRFLCDRWLAKNEDDGQIMRDLACANNDSIDLSDKTSQWARLQMSYLMNEEGFSANLTCNNPTFTFSLSQNMKSPPLQVNQRTRQRQKTPGSHWREGKLVPRSLS